MPNLLRRHLELLDLPDDLDVECLIAIGYPDEDLPPYKKEELDFNKVSYNRFGLNVITPGKVQ